MSIRQSPQLTPQLLDATRSNGRHSNGPRTEAGKRHSKMNALEHGERSDPENHDEVMRALGEDPAEFEGLKQELRASFSTGDSFIEKQIDDLARLYLAARSHGALPDRPDAPRFAGAGKGATPPPEGNRKLHDRGRRGPERHAEAPSTRRAPAPAALLSGTDSFAGARPLLPGLAGRRAPGLLPEQDRLARSAVVLSAVALRREQPASAAG